MDNNKTLAYDIANVLHIGQRIINNVKSGDGLNIEGDEEKKKFVTQFEKNGGKELISKLQEQMDALKKTVMTRANPPKQNGATN